jgi:tellurite resistance protein TehA-like permease
MTMRIGIVLASLALCGALFWSGTVLVALMMEWLVAHPWVAKAMAALPMLVLPLMAVTIVHWRRDAKRQCGTAERTAYLHVINNDPAVMAAHRMMEE